MSARKTRQRAEILEAMRRARTPLSIDEIFAATKGSMAKSTVYRNVAAMVARREAQRCFSDGRGATYRIGSDGGSGHWIVCDSCRAAVPIPACDTSGMERRAERDTGFVVTGRQVRMSGVCSSCRRR